ncbi:uncharacterized protein [Nicotiana sylvestris]|uniref:uncharacterized protein n=1 Tax=Nicotiana sylvestris TaxID=4096 RepID=UPI00388CBE3D
MEKKPNESFREYELRWREQATRVNPPMEENKMVEYFLQAQEPTYFGNLISVVERHKKLAGSEEHDDVAMVVSESGHGLKGTTPYLLVYGTEAVIPVEVKISSLRIVAEAEIDDDEWVKTRLEQLSLINEKRLAVVYHGQLYQKRMARSYNKKVRPQKFEVGQQVLKRILPHPAEAKGKFAPNWQGSFVVTRVLPNGALYLTDVEVKCVDMTINSNAFKRYYV